MLNFKAQNLRLKFSGLFFVRIPKIAPFQFSLGARTRLASVTPDRVRNRINLSSSDIGDSVVIEFIVDACAEAVLETGLTIDYNNCTQAEAACITDLAALYCCSLEVYS